MEIKEYNNNLSGKIPLGIGALILGCSLVLGGCNKIYEGQVQQKIHEHKREWVRGGISFRERVHHPLVHHLDDEDFIFHLARKTGDEFDTKTVYVSREIFKKTKIGDIFRYDGTNAEESDSVSKRLPNAGELEKCGHYRSKTMFENCDL